MGRLYVGKRKSIPKMFIYIQYIHIHIQSCIYIYIYIYIYTLRLFTIQKQIIHILKNKMIPHIDYLSIMHLNLQI